ncbi:putative nucleolar ribosomal biogenesis factor RPF1p [Myxozyma melibiosi]|uniref:Nucleolar ribosomal biogenesis factor RPF1p n=1 Tax=Myxozyma melibiosi TaxID=54550 RepID=A0ABR1F8U7_9ASCO
MPSRKTKGYKKRKTSSVSIPKDALKSVKNKIKRENLLAKVRDEHNISKHKARKERLKMEASDPELKAERLASNIPSTIEAMRVYDETVNVAAEGEDEFEEYFRDKKPPKVLITTSKNARGEAYELSDQLIDIIPGSEFVKRGHKFSMKEIAKFCNNREFTDLVVISEDKKEVNGLTFVHLPNGPTMFFSLTSLRMPKQISGHGRATEHSPELILNNFSTRLGSTVGRLFQSLFPQTPEFVGRQVVTLHNQRDFIFFRRHRYVFKETERVGLQELGPQFTLKLRRVQRGIAEEMEWEHRPDMDKEKHKFYL